MNLPPSPQPGSLAPFNRKMNLVTVFDPQRMVRTHTVSGTISLSAFRGILPALYASKQFNPDMNALWDLRLADFSGVMPEDVRNLMHVVVSNWGRKGNCHSAILVASETEYGVARIYVSQFGQAAPCKIKVFLDLNEARHWLGLGAESGTAVAIQRHLDSPGGQ